MDGIKLGRIYSYKGKLQKEYVPNLKMTSYFYDKKTDIVYVEAFEDLIGVDKNKFIVPYISKNGKFQKIKDGKIVEIP